MASDLAGNALLRLSALPSIGAPGVAPLLYAFAGVLSSRTCTHCSRRCSHSSAAPGSCQHLLCAGIRLLAQHGDGGGCAAAGGPHGELVLQLHLLLEGFIVRSELFYGRPEGSSREECDKLWGGDFKYAQQVLKFKGQKKSGTHLCLMKNCCVSANTLCSALAIQ